MKYVLVAEVPEALDLDAVDEDGNPVNDVAVLQTLESIGAKWPSSPAVGTTSFKGRKLIYLVVTMPEVSPIPVLEGAIAHHGLDWQLLAGQTFSNQEVVIDAETTVFKPIKVMEPNEARLFKFIPDRYLDEEQTIVDPNKHINWVSTYSGQAPWQAVD